MQGRLPPAAFRSFQDGRPDEERWELIDGTPVMMTTPLIDQNRIASTLERLLDDVLERHDPDREAVQRPGLELGLNPAALAGLGFAGAYRPDPAVASSTGPISWPRWYRAPATSRCCRAEYRGSTPGRGPTGRARPVGRCWSSSSAGSRSQSGSADRTGGTGVGSPTRIPRWIYRSSACSARSGRSMPARI